MGTMTVFPGCSPLISVIGIDLQGVGRRVIEFPGDGETSDALELLCGQCRFSSGVPIDQTGRKTEFVERYLPRQIPAERRFGFTDSGRISRQQHCRPEEKKRREDQRAMQRHETSVPSGEGDILIRPYRQKRRFFFGPR
jgi:hypothetical protein